MFIPDRRRGITIAPSGRQGHDDRWMTGAAGEGRDLTWIDPLVLQAIDITSHYSSGYSMSLITNSDY